MKVYRGDVSESFVVKDHLTSRYNFKALFFTTNPEVAKMYGFLYEFNILDPCETIDYNFKITHSSHFRNLIYQYKNTDLDSVLIKNVYDYPSKKHFRLIKSDILVVFNFSSIINYKRIYQ